MAETGQRVGDYEVIAPLGAGGMGRVFKVRNVISNREEAMKILLPDFAADPELAARFMAEIRTLAGLEHPGIAQLRTAFQHNNQFVMVMEFVEGITLEKLAEQVRIPLDHVLDYAMQVLAALSYAHGKGVTHRDIKPANIMITGHGVIKLMDFGIAKSSGDMQLTRPGSTMGSVYYMSPEQIQGDAVDGRSDIYSLGVTLYELLTGRKPFQADTSYSVLNAQLNQPPTPPLELNPSIPPELNDIVLRAMAKKPDGRFQSADDFRTALRGVTESRQRAVAGQPATAGQLAAVAGQPAAAGKPGAGIAESVWQSPEAFTPAPASAPPVYSAEPQYAAPDPPPFTPVAMPAPPPASAKPRRGLWIGLGAVTAVLVLAAVAWVLPRMLSTSASQKPSVAASDTATASSPASTQPDAPPTIPASTPPATEPEPASTTPRKSPNPPLSGAAGSPKADAGSPSQPQAPRGSRTPSGPPSRPRPAYVSPAASPVAPQPGPAASPATPQPAGPSPAELRDANDRYANLQARADAALASVEQIRSQQQNQGLDIRGDILVAMNRLHQQLEQARRALAQNDLETANQSMNRAENDTEKLEKFLGR
jgi:hypothetical protein